jgi:chemotaxis family two-component system sensor kinase Cph1
MKNEQERAGQAILTQDRESVRDFISMAVHDLREPLRAIRLGAQLLGANGRSTTEENAQKGTRFITEGTDRIEILLRDIAEYCNEEVRDPEVRRTNMEMVLREAQSEIAGEIKGCGATITHDPLPAVLGNFSSLAALLRCLIGNACKFRSDRSPQIHIRVVEEGSECLLSVEDNGQGFDPVYRDRIFKPFEKLNGKQYPGSGLGLTLAKRIVENHGGRIWAESHLGEGSIFRFSLPLAD